MRWKKPFLSEDVLLSVQDLEGRKVRALDANLMGVVGGKPIEKSEIFKQNRVFLNVDSHRGLC
jgi:hypothetical protein